MRLAGANRDNPIVHEIIKAVSTGDPSKNTAWVRESGVKVYPPVPATTGRLAFFDRYTMPWIFFDLPICSFLGDVVPGVVLPSRASRSAGPEAVEQIGQLRGDVTAADDRLGSKGLDGETLIQGIER